MTVLGNMLEDTEPQRRGSPGPEAACFLLPLADVVLHVIGLMNVRGALALKFAA